jgi:hypothetical protein
MKRYCAPLFLALAMHAGVHAEPSLRRDVGPNTNAAYEQECGGCHFPYQPGWLPERSWRKLMGSLGQHFGENAELKTAQHDALLAYLVAGAADHRRSQRSLEVLAAITPGDTPTRISSVLYVGGIHGGFLDPAFRGKPEVKTLAQCSACHQQANRGWFSAVTYSISDEDFRANAPKAAASGSVSPRLTK